MGAGEVRVEGKFCKRVGVMCEHGKVCRPMRLSALCDED